MPLVTPPAPVTLSTLVEKTGANFTGQSTPMEPRKVKAIMVECGGAHSLFLSQDNDVFACGLNDKGQLGLASGDFDSQSLPRRVEVLTDKTVTTIKAGSRHSACLTVEGYCYVWGDNSRGQLGMSEPGALRKEPCSAVPVIVGTLLGRGLSSLHCAYNQTFWGNSEPGYYAAIDSEIFRLWKNKLKRFEDKNLLKANNVYRNIKRVEKSMAQDRNSMGATASNMGSKSYNNQFKGTPNNSSSLKFPVPSGASSKQKLSNFATLEPNEVPLGPSPTLKNAKPSCYLLQYQQRLDKQDAKHKQVFEGEDFRSDDAVVTSFKKVSTSGTSKKAGKGRTTYVSSFPFSGHSRLIDGVDVMPAIEDNLPNQEELLNSVTSAGGEDQSGVDPEIAANPFVFMLNRAKMESFREEPARGQEGQDTVLRIPRGFSHFNKQTEFPYEPIPNVFKISPPEQSDSD